MMQRVYLSGPITGLPDGNRDAFMSAARRLRFEGYAVINPVEMAGFSALDWKDYMRQDLRWLADCDVIAMLPGWEKSRGARCELSVALSLAFGVMNAETLEFFDIETKAKWLNSLKEVFDPTPEDEGVLC
jgi:predicted outer membrane lipoprotein